MNNEIINLKFELFEIINCLKLYNEFRYVYVVFCWIVMLVLRWYFVFV